MESISKSRLRDVVIGSAIAAALVLMMPSDRTPARAILSGTIVPRQKPAGYLPKPKPGCAKPQHDKSCDIHASAETLRKLSLYRKEDAENGAHRVDIRA